MEKEIERLYKNTWSTRGARLYSASRLKRHDTLSNCSITLMSVYIICLNLVELLPKEIIDIFPQGSITYITICFSIFILSISQIISSKDYKLRADKFHSCGREIKEIYDTLSLWKNCNNIPSEEKFRDINKDYINILDKYENHKKLDYIMFQCDHMKEFNKDRLDKFLIYTRYYLSFSQYYLLIISPLLLFFIIN